MNTRTVTQTRFFKDGIEMLITDLTGDFLEMTRKNLRRNHGFHGWTEESRTITTTTTDWK